MVADIGIMIGFYIFTRMAEVLFPKDAKGHVVVVLLAVVTALVAVICVADIFMSGTSAEMEQIMR